MDHKKEMEKMENEYADSYSFERLWSPAINTTYPLGYSDINDPMLSIVMGSIPSRKTVNELLEKYPFHIFNFEYLEHYWAYNTTLSKIK